MLPALERLDELRTMQGNSRTLAIIFITVAAVTLGSTALIYWMGLLVNSTNQAVIRSRDLVADSEEMLDALRGGEIGRRAFELTGDPAYLEPCHLALVRLPRDLADIERAAQAGEMDGELAADIVRLGRLQIDELHRIANPGPATRPAPPPPTAAATRPADELEGKIQQMRGLATASLFANRRHRDRVNNLRTLVAAGTAPVILLFLLWSYRQLRRGIAGMERAVEALRRYELLAGNSRDIILFLRRDNGAVLEANAAAVAAYGYGRDELLKLSIQDLRAPDALHLAAGQMAQADTQGILFETVHRRKDGRCFPVEVSSRGAEIGGTRTLISVIRDITERKQAERFLRESREDLNRAQAVARTGSWRMNVQRNELHWSDETYRIFGVVPGTPLTYESFIEAIHPEDRERVDQAWQAALRGQPYEIEHRIVADGTVKWVAERAQLEFDAQGQLLGGFGTVQDITARKQAQDALAAAKLAAEKAKAEAEEANKAKDHFLAVLSHELRTPLTPVVTALSMLQHSSGLDPETRDSLEMVRRNVELETRLIDDLLDVTRIARGKVELIRKPLDLCAVIERAIDVCRPDIEARGLRLTTEWGDRPFWIEGDSARLQQVFWNLLKNAVKFTPQNGSVTLRCRGEDVQPPANRTVRVEIIDSGIGIDPETLPRLFNAFEQAERSITRRFGGLGLGLAISKSLVELHGGTISAHSDGKDKGATFTVRLPLAEQGPERTSQNPVTSGQHADSSSADYRLPTTGSSAPNPLRILLVEDHGDTARMMQRLLKLEGHAVRHAADIATALTLADTQPFDLLLSDLGLPDGTGHDLMRELRRRGNSLPGIVLSGFGLEEDIQHSREAGFIAHLVKPVTSEQLTDAIASFGGKSARAK